MFALGRSERRKGFSKEELEKLASVMAAKIVGNGYTRQELQKGLSSGYQYVDLSYKPEHLYLCGAPSTSKNQLIRRLKINGKLGLIINTSELDMISGAMKQKCGHHDDVFHHESISTDYKIDDQIICAEDPHLALSFTGTPNQLAFFIPSLNNGLYSRFAILTAESRWKYRSTAPIKGKEDYDTFFKKLSGEVLDMFLFLQQSPTEVTLSDSQWEEHTAYFSQLLNEVACEKADAPGSIVLRAALIVARIACRTFVVS
ncbi:DUF3987 domain-containing protein [Bacteroides acidifaciens]|uniref:DUF3987 domain-containing protein n=2 Tax=Bacteroides acidifaciens TaxID=85831 RepID=A0A3L8A6N7_9BACE|nr:DUF3987 domain-containing protein [Bacteroides acidifaciens]